MDSNNKEPPEDPRAKSNRYSKGARAKFEIDHFDFVETQFLIDDNYIGVPPKVQVSIENLNDNIDEDFLRKEISKIHGKVREGTLEIIRNPKTRQHLGLARVQFSQVSMAQTFVDTFDGKKLMGLVLSVYKDLRFARIEKVKADKLNPKPVVPQIMQQNHILPTLPAPPANLQNSNLPPHLLPSIYHPLQQQQLRLPKSNNSTIPPSPHSLDYTITTPSSTISTPDPSNRQRLEDRIASLLKQPNFPLATIVAPVAPQASPTYPSAFNETSYFDPHTSKPPIIENEYDKPRNNNHNHNHHSQHNHHHHHHHHSYKNNKVNNNYPDDNEKPKEVKKPLEVELTESQVEDQILPYSYDKFYRELSDNLFLSEFKRLREKCGFAFLAKAKEAYDARKQKQQLEEEKEKMERQHVKDLERKWLRPVRERVVDDQPRQQRATFIRQRNTNANMIRDDRRHNDSDLQRINRSSANIAPERRGSHTTSLDSDSSDDDDSSKGDSSSSLSSRSTSPSSQSSSSSDLLDNEHIISDRSTSSPSPSSYVMSSDDEDETRKEKNENELQEAAEALLSLGASESKPPAKAVGRKRKKPMVASENKAKRFAPEPFEIEQPQRFTFPERSAEEKQQMLDDLFGTLDEEDIHFLEQVHNEETSKNDNDVQIYFGSKDANKAHLNMRRKVIETGKALENHPKWWRGCSRCDVIEVSEKQRVQEEDDEENEENRKKEQENKKKEQKKETENKAYRRDQRGDQRRMVALNPEIDINLLKQLTISTLQMRAKNLRFSRSSIHNWGLFACESIAKGDAVVEYVGEKIRPSLADHREKNVYANLPTHDGSSYFFRVDYEVIDATLKGNKARFINHSCNPNCFAKVIKHDNGSNSIVIYAKQAIRKDDEITYDYKFPREEGVDKIVCCCNAPNCQKHLN